MSGFDKLKVLVPESDEQEKLDDLIVKQSIKIKVLKDRKKVFTKDVYIGSYNGLLC